MGTRPISHVSVDGKPTPLEEALAHWRHPPVPPPPPPPPPPEPFPDLRPFLTGAPAPLARRPADPSVPFSRFPDFSRMEPSPDLHIPSPQDLAVWRHTTRSIHPNLRRTFCDANRPFLSRIHSAIIKADIDALIANTASWLQVPKAVLIRKRGGKKAGRNFRNRLALFASRARSDDVVVGPACDAHYAHGLSPLTDTERKIMTCKRQMRAGNFKKGVQALSNEEHADLSDPAIREKCREKHPQPEDRKMPTCPEVPDVLVEPTEAWITTMKSSLCNGSGPSLYGWTGELVAVLLDDPECAKGLAALVELIRNDKLPKALKEILLASKFLAFKKKEDDVRPIAMGSILYKMACLDAWKEVRDDLRALFEPIQLGIGTAGGAQTAAVVASALLSADDLKLAGLSFDFKNAYNTIRRDVMLQAVFDQPTLRPLWKLVSFAYSSPSSLVADSATGLFDLVSAEGVRQGDVLAPLLFSVAVQALYVKAVQEANLYDTDEKEQAQAIAILDDITFIGPPKRVTIAGKYLIDHSEELGLVVSRPKSTLVWMREDPLPADLTAFSERYGIQVVGKCFRFLGIPMGYSDECVKHAIHEHIKGWDNLFSILTHRSMPSDIAFRILTDSLIPRLTYLSRVVPPHIMHTAAQAFDRKVLLTAAKLLKLRLPDSRDPEHAFASMNAEALERTRLPLRYGGLGLRPSASILEVAYISGLASAAKLLTNSALTAADGVPLAAVNKHLNQYINACIDHISSDAFDSAVCRPLVPDSSLSLDAKLRKLAKGANHLQKALTQSMEKTKAEKLESHLGPQPTARLHSTTGRYAAAWLSDSTSCMPDYAFRIACRTRIGLPPTSDLPDECVCSCRRSDKKLREYPNHFQDCKKTNHATIRRHDAVSQTLASAIREIGGVAIVEPHSLSSMDAKRPDVDYTLPDGSHGIIDVTIRNPTAPSNIRIAQSRLAVASKAEQEKKAKYSSMVDEIDTAFIPFAVESLGAFGECAEKFVSELAALAEEQCPGSGRPFKRKLVRNISTAIQVGNAMCVVEGLANVHRIGSRRLARLRV